MRKNSNKRALYESIMKKVSKVVKESVDCETLTLFDRLQILKC